MLCEHWQDGHYQQGMVFAINPGNQFPAFQAAAMYNTTTQSSATPTSSVAASSTSSSNSHDRRIKGGGINIVAFQLANTTTQPGDTITFEFHQKNHTATQSLPTARHFHETLGWLRTWFVHMPVADNATRSPTFTIHVNDTNPIWAFCCQGDHFGEGMVFSVNANESSSNNFTAFQACARQINGTNSTSDDTKISTLKGNSAGPVHLGGTGIASGSQLPFTDLPCETHVSLPSTIATGNSYRWT